MNHFPWQCRPETCGGIDYDPCPAAAATTHEHRWTPLCIDCGALVVPPWAESDQ